MAVTGGDALGMWAGGKPNIIVLPRNCDMTDIVLIDSINFCSLSSARFSLPFSFAANSFSDSSLLSCSFACTSSTSFTTLHTCHPLSVSFAIGLSSSGKLGVKRCVLTAGAGAEGQLLTAGPGVEGQLLTAGPGVVD